MASAAKEALLPPACSAEDITREADRSVLDSTGPLAFCTACGQPIGAGGCPNHSAPGDSALVPHVLDADIGGARNRSRRPLLAAIAISLVLALMVGWIVSLQGQIHGMRSDLARTSARLGSVSTRATDGAKTQQQVTNALSGRIGAVEARINSQPDPASIARRASGSVFTIETDTGQGSGFAMGSSGAGTTFVTNFHVVSDTWNTGGRTVSLKHGDATYTGTIIKVDPADDLAVIQAGITVAPLTKATIAPQVGDPVLVIGTPLGIGESVTSGIVSGFPTQEGQTSIQFSAPISPGNSGGPLVDRSGNVIGVAEAKAVGGGAEGLSFAIPVDQVCSGLSICT
jgi:putative serine protease PepD